MQYVDDVVIIVVEKNPPIKITIIDGGKLAIMAARRKGTNRRMVLRLSRAAYVAALPIVYGFH